MAHSEATSNTTVPQTITRSYSVEIWPRNVGSRYDNTFTVEVQATSKQEAINKAITEHPGHVWGAVKEFEQAPDNTGLWERAWEPTKREGEEVTLQQIVTEAIGTGSMCWLPKPEGTFNSEMAQWVAGGAINEIEKLVFWQIENERKNWGSGDVNCDQAEDPTLSAGVKYEAAVAEEPEEAKQWRIQRDADKASVIDLILSYRNPASDAEKLRQIRVVME